MAQGQQTVEYLHTPRSFGTQLQKREERSSQKTAGAAMTTADFHPRAAQLPADEVPVADIEYPLAVRFELPATLSHVCASGRTPIAAQHQQPNVRTIHIRRRLSQ